MKTTTALAPVSESLVAGFSCGPRFWALALAPHDKSTPIRIYSLLRLYSATNWKTVQITKLGEFALAYPSASLTSLTRPTARPDPHYTPSRLPGFADPTTGEGATLLGVAVRLPVGGKLTLPIPGLPGSWNLRADKLRLPGPNLIRSMLVSGNWRFYDPALAFEHLSACHFFTPFEWTKPAPIALCGAGPRPSERASLSGARANYPLSRADCQQCCIILGELDPLNPGVSAP